MINLENTIKTYKPIGDKKFKSLTSKNKPLKKGKIANHKILESVTCSIRKNKKVTGQYLMESLKVSKSSIGTCIKNLFDRGLIKKKVDKNKPGYPVTYIWSGEK